MIKKLADRLRGRAAEPESALDRGWAALQAGDSEGVRLALGAWLQETPGPHEPDKLVAAARMLAEAHCGSDAERLLRDVLERTPEHVEARTVLARVLIDAGNELHALEEIDRALAAATDDTELRLLAAFVHDRLGAHEGAAAQLRAVLVRTPEHAEANQRLADLYTRVGKIPEAIERYRHIVATTQGDEPLLTALTALGIALSSDGQHDEAIRILSDVTSRQPGVGPAHANLGMALLEAGRLEPSIAAFLRALEIDAASAQAHCGLGLAYQRQGRLVDAAEAFGATERLAPRSAVAALNLGLALDALGDQEGARRALLRAAAIAPDDAEIRGALGKLMSPPEPAAPHGRAPVATDFEAGISGDIRTFALLDVIEFLRVQGKSGALVVSSRHGAGLVRLADGAITSASAPRTKRLGDTLVERGLISRANLERALAAGRGSDPESPESLGGVLLRMRLVDRGRLERVVHDQMLGALDQMLGWTEGAFSFHAHVPGTGEEPSSIAFEPQGVLMELMRRRDEHAQPSRRGVPGAVPRYEHRSEPPTPKSRL